MDKIFKSILGGIAEGKIDKYIGAQLIGLLQKTECSPQQDIAIVGMALNMPGAKNLDSYWENILGKVDCIRYLSESRVRLVDQYLKDLKGQEKCKYKEGGFLEEVDIFDYDVFRLLPNEARLMDPNQRLFLQTAWHALEDAGFCGSAVRGSKTGVFVGYAESGNYKNMLIDTQPENYSIGMVGNIAAMLPSRLSYLLDLKGPSMVIDTACSSSMIGVYLACRSLMAGDCETAVAAGVKLDIFPVDDDNTRIGIESTDSRTNTFSNEANGAALGEGAAALVLKPLEKALSDKDHVYGVIKSCSVNQDGASMGITAPSAKAQSEVILDAWNKAGINPLTLAFIEAHGTGTKLGDPIELQGLKKAFEKYTDKKQFCAIGSVKTNIGHLYECSGMASMIKCVLALNNKIIPPTSNFRYPNREINFSDSALYVNTKARKWNRDEPMRCGISSFGLSGTNCHMVLEEPPVFIEDRKADTEEEWNIFTASAYSADRLEALLKEYLEFLTQTKLHLSDLCFTANTGREVFACRIAICTNHLKDLTKKIEILLNKGVRNYKAEWFYYGQDGEKQKETGDQKKRSGLELNEKNDQQIKIYEKGSKEEILHLGHLFTAGAEINWDKVYFNKNAKRIRLPGYVFQPYKCWLDYHEKAVPTSGVENQLLFEQCWVEQNKELLPQFCLRDRKILYIDSGKEQDFIGEQIKLAGYQITEVHVRSGADYFFSDSNVIIDGSEEQYCSAVSELSKTGLECVIFSYGCQAGEDEKLEGFESSYYHGTLGLFYFIKALLKANWTKDLNVFVLAENVFQLGEGEKADPFGASLFGLGKIVQKELNHLICRCIEYDDKTSLDTLLCQMESADTEAVVAYRGQKRYVHKFSPAGSKKIKSKKDRIRSNGVYLITGGLGGIGTEISKYIASQTKSRIILVNRTVLPKREEWKYILEKDAGGNLSKKIKSFLEIEKLGAKVIYYSGDVSNYDQMKWIVEDIKSKYGEIHGIIHAAGIGKSDFLKNRTAKEFKALYEPKVKGAWNLDVLTGSMSLDFFIMFSSVAAIFPAVAQGDYVAANSFLDALSIRRRSEGRPYTTINWTTWKETGMALESDYQVDTIFRLLSTKDAITGFDTVLRQSFSNVLIGYLNGTSVGASLLKNSRVFLSEELDQFVGKHVHKKEMENLSDRNNNQKRMPQTMSQLEDQLVAICQKILGIEWINPSESFFEMGADSIFLYKIFQEVDKLYPGVLTITQLFEYVTVERLADYITKHTKSGQKKSQNKRQTETDSGRQIAVIGMALRAPNADSCEQFWENSIAGADCIRKIPKERKEELSPYLNYKGIHNARFRENGYLDNISLFDPFFFKLSARDAMLMDPHQRMFLKTAWEAIEGAGYGGKQLSGTKTGVYLGYAGILRDIYFNMLNDVDITEEAFLDNLMTMMPGRLSYLLNLKGPSLVFDTACSSSLVAVEMASQAIRNGTIDYAIAAGIKLNLLPLDNENMKIGIESGSGRSCTFSNEADGSAVGEGVGAVLLKRLDRAQEDGDNILAIIRGVAANQDGSTAGITVPNPSAQSQVIEAALLDADIDAETISYIEAHGTGTNLGDPIEIQGINSAMERFTAKKQFCAVSSTKTMIGHSSEAAGILSFIRAVLSLIHKQIPASLNFNMPNKTIDFSNTAVYVNTKTRSWAEREHPRRCGISAFGISGTNCHIVLEEAPLKLKEEYKKELYLFAISARSQEALYQLIRLYTSFVKENEPDLLSLCYTAETGRDHFAVRLAFVFATREQLIEKLNELVQHGVMHCSAVYYGERKLVNNNKSVIEENEITLKHQKELTKEAEELLDNTWQESEEQLQELARLYSNGGEIPWKQIYKGQKIDRIYLPAYCFEEKKYWFECPEKKWPDSLPIREEGFYHTVSYQRIDAEPRTIEAGSGTILLLVKPGQKMIPMLEALKRHGAEVYQLEWDGSEHGFMELWQYYSNKNIIQIIHMLTFEGNMEVNGLEQLDAALESGVCSMLNLVKTLEGGAPHGNIRLDLITSYAYAPVNGQEQFRPENAALLALGKVISQECPQLLCHGVDADFETDAEILARELLTEHKHYLTLFRKGLEYREEFKEVDLRYIPNEKVSIKPEGVYIVTGGLGGIGLVLSQYFAKQKAGHIAALGRSELPPRAEWNNILDQSKADKQKDIIQAINNIEKMGTTLEYFPVDVTNEKAIQLTIGNLIKRYGRVNGIVHGAGITGDGFLVLKSMEKFKATLKPKIYGTYILDQQTKDLDMDFFVLFSSNDTLFGKEGQGDYTAANSYLDAMTYAMNQRGRKTLAINWVAWKEIGLAKKYGSIKENDMFDALTNQQGIYGFMQALNKRIARVIIGKMNYGSPVFNDIEKSPIPISKDLCTAIQNTREEIGADESSQPQKAEYEEVELAGNKEGIYTKTQKELAGIWGYHLGMKQVNIYDDFYQYGGDSILALKISHDIAAYMGKSISVVNILQCPSIERLAQYLEENTKGSVKIAKAEKLPFYPLSPAQYRLFIVHQFDKTKKSNNISHVFKIHGELQIEWLQEALNQLIKRHDSLRTSFVMQDGTPVQVIHKSVEFAIERLGKVNGDLLQAIENWMKPFDLEKAPLMRFGVWKLDEENWLLAFVFHHIITDGTSMDIFMKDLTSLYNGSEMKPVTYQYCDYTQWVMKRLAAGELDSHARFWKKVMHKKIPELVLISDWKRPPVKTFRGGIVWQKFDSGLTGEILDLCRKMSITHYIFLLSCYYVLLHKYSAQNDIIVGTPVSGREQNEFNDTMGVFINTLAMRCEINPEVNFLDFMNKVKDITLEAFAHQEYPFNFLVRDLNIKSSLQRNPLFDVYFALQNVGNYKGELEVLNGEEVIYERGIARFDLSLDIYEEGTEFRLALEYSSDLFQRESAERILKDYIGIVRSVLRENTLAISEISLASLENRNLPKQPEAAEEDDILFQF